MQFCDWSSDVCSSDLDPELLRVFLWSKDYRVCTRTFKWCVDLASISQPAAHGDANCTPMFIPETMGYAWVEHFVHVLCQADYFTPSWDFLLSHLVPKWTTLPSSWCCDFATAFLFSIVQLPNSHGLPAYQCFVQSHMEVIDLRLRGRDEFWEDFPCFLATLLESTKYSLTWTSLTSIENWWSQAIAKQTIHDAQTQMEQILAITKQQLVGVTLGFFQELPFVGL